MLRQNIYTSLNSQIFLWALFLRSLTSAVLNRNLTKVKCTKNENNVWEIKLMPVIIFAEVKLFAQTIIRWIFFIAALHVSVIWIDFYRSTFWWCRWFIRADEKSFLAQDEIEFFTRALRGRQQVSQKTRKQKQPKLSLTFRICLCLTGSSSTEKPVASLWCNKLMGPAHKISAGNIRDWQTLKLWIENKEEAKS